jgi:predicted lipid carrier protein YhbT
VVRPLPWLLTAPARLLPAQVHSAALAVALGQIWGAELRAGELDFLRDRVLAVRVEDVGVQVSVTLSRGRFREAPTGRRPDLAIAGNAYELLLLASGREDPDTLFFQRRLRLEGDAELGLYVKNFLEALDPESGPLPLPLRRLLHQAVPLYEWLFAR